MLKYCPAFFCLAIASCTNDITEIRAIADPSKMPVQTVTNAYYTYSENGHIKNTLKAAQIDQYDGDEGYIEANGGFEMDFFDSLQVEEARLTAKHGNYSNKTKVLRAWEKVELSNREGEKLETEALIFSQDSNRIYTDQFVVIKTKSGTIYGHGLESNSNFTKYKILKPSGEMIVNEKP
jgi:LPS export ABC transporter protein LptC